MGPIQINSVRLKAALLVCSPDNAVSKASNFEQTADAQSCKAHEPFKSFFKQNF